MAGLWLSLEVQVFEVSGMFSELLNKQISGSLQMKEHSTCTLEASFLCPRLLTSVRTFLQRSNYLRLVPVDLLVTLCMSVIMETSLPFCSYAIKTVATKMLNFPKYV